MEANNGNVYNNNNNNTSPRTCYFCNSTETSKNSKGYFMWYANKKSDGTLIGYLCSYCDFRLVRKPKQEKKCSICFKPLAYFNKNICSGCFTSIKSIF